MIIASVLLIVTAVALLVTGLLRPSSMLLSGSIAASLLAAVTLVVGARRSSAAAPLATAGQAEPVGPGRRLPDAAPYPVEPSHPFATSPPPDASPEVGVEPAAAAEVAAEPVDEPSPQQVSPADAARVGQLTTEVLVVDGRPRYHLPGCVHLLGRDCEPLPVGEAVELGFTPCGLCEPASALLADGRQL